MKSIIEYFIFIVLIFEINSLLPPEKREELLSKYTKKISPENFGLEGNHFSSGESISYDTETITGILSTYDFPQNFNFLETHGITPVIKDQEGCGSCWAFAASTALAYRFKLKGLDLDLSPQHALSCYLRDCELGNVMIDPQLNLIKNGTVTEQCLPYTSGSKVIEECPAKCKDGSDIKKYYSQNAYTTDGLVTETNYYDIVTLIIDQLISKGPVATGIIVYKDFNDLAKNANCPNTIYKYDGRSKELGGHAIVIVGYGYSESDKRYYWIIQNSWGNVCDNGFMKIEFGQVGIENIAFSEPYLEEEGKTPQEVNLVFKKKNTLCEIEIVPQKDEINKWENTLEINFESEDKKRNFNYYCGITTGNKLDKKYSCYFEIMNYYAPINNFKYKGYKSLGKENTFNIDSITELKDFTFYGNYYIFPSPILTQQYFYVSEEGSKVILFWSDEYTNKGELPPIYPNIKNLKPLSHCEKVFISEETEDLNLIVCDLTEQEVNYFYNIGTNPNSMLYDVLCGYKDTTGAYTYKLDKEKYPIFRVKKVYLPKSGKISGDTLFQIETTIEGKLSYTFKGQYILGFATLENNNVNSSYYMQCDMGNPNETSIDYNITCQIQISGKEEKNYNNLYILPYITQYPLDDWQPYEVILKETLQPGEDIQPDPTDPTPTDPSPTDPDPRPTAGDNINLSFMVFTLIAILF